MKHFEKFQKKMPILKKKFRKSTGLKANDHRANGSGLWVGFFKNIFEFPDSIVGINLRGGQAAMAQ